MASVLVRNLGRQRSPLPTSSFVNAARGALKGWELSLAFVSEADAKRLNKTLRKKSYTPNVLSYQTGDKSGEILICLPVAKKQAPSYGLSYAGFVALLFIHAMLHLEGYRHGPTMDEVEQRRLRRLAPHNLNEAPNRNRNRHRNLAGKDRRR